MRAKTEELLYLLLWTADKYGRPSYRTVGESFEGWAYRKGLLRRLQRLERKKFLESQPGPRTNCLQRLYRLTDAGRIQALGGRDPEACWGRPWDGTWRLVLFDVPESRRGIRNKLRRYLSEHGFGYLQNSVWVTPDPVTEQRVLLADGPVDAESLVFFDARPAAGESNADIVGGAWNWAAINECHDRYREILACRPTDPLRTAGAAEAFKNWLGRERRAWMEVLLRDPFLPKSLLPNGYTGQMTWQLRVKAIREAGEQLRLFVPSELE